MRGNSHNRLNVTIGAQWNTIVSVRVVRVCGSGGDIVCNGGNWRVHRTNDGSAYGINFFIGGYLNGDVGGGIN